jgi:hypothetical protein
VVVGSVLEGGEGGRWKIRNGRNKPQGMNILYITQYSRVVEEDR